MKRLIILPLAALSVAAAHGQKFDWKAEFATRFDNREYRSEYSSSKTQFGMRLTPEAGVTWGEGHRVMGGGSLIRLMGAGENDQPMPELVLYYNYKGDRVAAAAGAFPRDMMTKYPREIFSSSTAFYDPLIEGMMVRYGDRKTFAEFACDWHGMQTATERERFVLFSAGRVALPARFAAGYYAAMHHFAGSATEHGVVDNILVRPYVSFAAVDGRDFKLRIDAGWLQALQRDRANENEALTPGGFVGEVEAVWRRLGVNNLLYAGDGTMPLYDRYGGALYLADSYYRTAHGLYDRLELFWAPRIDDAISRKLSSLHHYDGAVWGWQQTVTFSVRL
jgi:hypothetical protein